MRYRLMSIALIGILFLSTLSEIPFPIQHLIASQDSPIPYSETILHQEKADYTKNLHFNWSAKDIRWTMSEQGMIAALEGLSMTQLPGKPILPYQIYHYEIPFQKKPVFIKTTRMETEIIPMVSEQIPLAEDPLVFQESEIHKGIQPIPESYNKTCFPEENYEWILLSEKGQRSLRLYVYPMHILKGDMYLVTNLTVSIGLKDEDENHPQSVLTPNNQAVILCPDELADSAKALQKLQETDGYKVRVITLSEAKQYRPSEEPAMDGILGFSDYPDSQKSSILSYDLETALRIRTMLKTLLKENRIGYLTIMGDATYIPPSYYVSSEDGLGEYEQWLPTDYFYMAPEAKGDQYSFDINVGRLPVRSPEDAERIVDKLRRYRKALRPSWFKNVALMGGDPFDRDYFGEMVLNDAVNHDYFKGMTIQRFFKTEGLYSTKAVLDGFKKGENGFLWALGHGTGDGLALEPGRVDAKDIIDLPKNDMLPIVVSESCDNGAFDSRIVRPAYRSSVHFKDPTSFSEAVMLSEGAGIAYIGGVRTNFGGWIKDYDKGVLDISYLYYTDAMITHFFENYSKGASTLGDLVRNAMLQYMKEDWFTYYTHTKTFFGFTFQGDPTLKLPYLPGEVRKSVRAPELSYQEAMPLTYDSLPLFSMNDGFHIQAKSDSPRLSYIISDYLDDVNPVCAKGEWKKTNTSLYEHYFTPDRKTMMAIRIQAEDYKETRIVFYSRYNYDLVIHQEEDLKLLNLNETKEYSFFLANEGIFKADNVEVTIQTPSRLLKTYKIPYIPIMSSRNLNFSVTGKDPGEIAVSVKASVMEKETVTTDNESAITVQVSQEPIARVGVLQASEQNSKEYYEGRLIIHELNRYFREKGQPVEVVVVPIAKDQRQLTSLDRLNVDMVVLYTPYFYTESIQDLLYHLEQFERNGGLVLGISCLGYNQFGYPMTELQEFFGIHPKESVYLLYEADRKIDFTILNDEDQLFSQDHYNMRSRFFVSSGGSWDDISLSHASLVAISEDQQVALTRSGSRFFYSGYLSEQDLVLEDDALRFLTELISIPLYERLDISLQAVSIDPIEGSHGKAPVLTVNYKNVGNVPVENLSLLVNHTETFDLSPLEPNESATFVQPLSLTLQSDIQDIYVEIVVKEKQKERNTMNNQVHFSYYTQSGSTSGKSTITIDGGLERNVMEDTEIVTGKVTVGARLYVNDKPLAVNTDGTFATLLKLNEGKQAFHFVAWAGDTPSETVTLKVHRQRNKLIQLRINDTIPYYDHQPGNALEAPPFIYQSLTYVPLRLLAEAFGSVLEYDAGQRRITIRYKDLTIYMQIGEKQATVENTNGSSVVVLQGPCIIVKGRSFVPIRFIAETFGAKVEWNADLELVSITRTLDVPDISPPEMNMATDTAVQSDWSQTILQGNNEGKLLNPTCIDPLEDGSLLVSSFDGIYRWDLENEPKKIYDFLDWKGSLLKDFDWQKANAVPNRLFFRHWGENILLSDQSTILVIDPKTNTLIHSIPATYYGTYLYPKQSFAEMSDLEIEGNIAYVLNQYEGISMIDLLSGEVVCRYPLPHYPVSFVVEKNILIAAGFFGDITRLDLITGEILLYHPTTAIYPQSIFQNQETLYLQLIQPKGIFEITLLNEKVTLGTVKKLSNLHHYTAEQLYFLSKGMYGLIVDPDSLKSSVTKLHANFTVDSKIFEETDTWLEENSNFNITVDQTWITGDDQILITQKSPGDSALLKFYNFKGEWQKDLPIEVESDETEILGIQYVGASTVVILLFDEQYSVQIIQFKDLKKTQYRTVELDVNPYLMKPKKWTADDRYLCIWNEKTAKNVVYDIKNGRQVRQFDTYSLDYQPIYLSEKRIMQYENGQLYLFDVITGVMRVFDAKGKIHHQWNMSTLYEGQFRRICHMKILNESEFVLLDEQQGQLLFVKDGALYKTIDGFLRPVSMDIMDQKLLMNEGGRFEITINSIREEQEKKPTLTVYPAVMNADISYPIEWSAFMRIEMWDQNAPIVLDHPKEILYEYVKKGDQSMVIQWKLRDTKTFDKAIQGVITISTDKTKVQVSIHLKKSPVTMEIHPLLIKKGSKIDYPKLPNKIEQEKLFMEFFTLQQVFPFTCTEMNGDLMIAMPNDTILIKTKTGKATLIRQDRSEPFDLGGEIQLHKGRYWIPMNAIFTHLALIVDTRSFPIVFDLPPALIANSGT